MAGTSLPCLLNGDRAKWNWCIMRRSAWMILPTGSRWQAILNRRCVRHIPGLRPRLPLSLGSDGGLAAQPHNPKRDKADLDQESPKVERPHKADQNQQRSQDLACGIDRAIATGPPVLHQRETAHIDDGPDHAAGLKQGRIGSHVFEKGIHQVSHKEPFGKCTRPAGQTSGRVLVLKIGMPTADEGRRRHKFENAFFETTRTKIRNATSRSGDLKSTAWRNKVLASQVVKTASCPNQPARYPT